ncbi:MAG: hypothetical protein ACTSWW_12130 [Promethearchaeota archaeon]
MSFDEKTNVEERDSDPLEEKAEKETKKLYFGFMLLLVLVTQIALIIDQPTWQIILVLEGVVVVIVAMFGFVWWVISQPVDKKSRILKSIDEMEEKGHLEYQSYEGTIDCTAYSEGYDLISFLGIYFLIFVFFLDKQLFTGDAPPELITLYFFIFFPFVFIPAVSIRWKTDRIEVDPRNQTFIVRRIVWWFFYSRNKHVFPWIDVDIINGPELPFPEKYVTFNFSPQFQTKFTPGRDDYHKIIPKYFLDLKNGNDELKMRALKVLTLYDTKLKKNRRWVYSIAICVALIEVLLLQYFF